MAKKSSPKECPYIGCKNVANDKLKIKTPSGYRITIKVCSEHAGKKIFRRNKPAKVIKKHG